MNRLFKFIPAAAFALLARAASAQDGGYYISGEGGLALLPDLHLTNTPTGTQHEDFNTGYAFGGAAGYDTGTGMRVELDSLYTLSGLKKLDGISAPGHLRSTSLMVNGQFDLTHGTQITPYVGAGLGFEDISARAGSFTGNDWKPAYQAEAGVRDDLSQKVSLFGEYRFTQSEAAKLSDGIDTAHQHFADNGLLAGVTYHLGGD